MLTSNLLVVATLERLFVQLVLDILERPKILSTLRRESLVAGMAEAEQLKEKLVEEMVVGRVMHLRRLSDTAPLADPAAALDY